MKKMYSLTLLRFRYTFLQRNLPVTLFYMQSLRNKFTRNIAKLDFFF